MNQTTDFDRLVTSWLETAGPAQPEARVVDAALSTARTTVQRHGLRAFLLGPAAWPARGRSMWTLSPTLRTVIVAALIGAAIVGALWVGSQLRTQPSLVPPLPRSYRGELVASPDLTTPRLSPVLATLHDGRVLILGGNSGMTTSEVYDPEIGATRLTGQMVSADGLTVIGAVTLVDGRVLVIGDARAANPFVAVVQVFDPQTLQFEATGPMVTPRTQAALALLADGRVLVAGGTDPNDLNTGLRSVELFDPATGMFSAAGEMLEPRLFPEAASLPDGRALIVGGLMSGPDNTMSDVTAEIFDPDTGRFSPAGSWDPPGEGFPPNSQYSLLVALSDGRVVTFVPGLEMSGVMPGLWDPETNTWTADGYSFRDVTSATLLDGDQVLVTGPTGRDASWSGMYDAVSGVLTSTQSPRGWSPASIRLPDGRALLVGGLEDGNIRPEGGGNLAPAVSFVEIFE